MAERHGLFGFLLDDRATAELKLEARTAGTAMTSPALTIAPTGLWQKRRERWWTRA